MWGFLVSLVLILLFMLCVCVSQVKGLSCIVVWTLGKHRALAEYRKGSIRSSLGIGDHVLTLFSLCFHLDLLEDEQRLSMGEFDKCNYLRLAVLFLRFLYEVLVGFWIYNSELL